LASGVDYEEVQPMTKILVVEDSIYQRSKIRRALAGEGYEFLEASDGREGLEMYAAHEPDCMLLDLTMPEMDGIKVLRALQELQEQKRAVGVIVLTADIQESTRQKCLSLGADAFINKPLQEEELLQTVKQVCRSLALASAGPQEAQ
jgi:twitching motility two-component system response regulator PilH